MFFRSQGIDEKGNRSKKNNEKNNDGDPNKRTRCARSTLGIDF